MQHEYCNTIKFQWIMMYNNTEPKIAQTSCEAARKPAPSSFNHLLHHRHFLRLILSASLLMCSELNMQERVDTLYLHTSTHSLSPLETCFGFDRTFCDEAV